MLNLANMFVTRERFLEKYEQTIQERIEKNRIRKEKMIGDKVDK